MHYYYYYIKGLQHINTKRVIQCQNMHDIHVYIGAQNLRNARPSKSIIPTIQNSKFCPKSHGNITHTVLFLGGLCTKLNFYNHQDGGMVLISSHTYQVYLVYHIGLPVQLVLPYSRSCARTPLLRNYHILILLNRTTAFMYM